MSRRLQIAVLPGAGLGQAVVPAALPVLERLSGDTNPDVREIAGESLEALRA